MLIFLSALLAFLLLPDAANAGPVFVAALTSASSAFAASSLGVFLSSTVGRLLMSVALSALQASLQERPKSPGIVTETTLTGSTQPLTFTLGLYATAGQLACPPMSHGKDGKTPNAYRTYVVTLGAVPGTKLSRLMLNGEYVDLGTTAHADYGLPVLGRYEGYAWVKYYDGSQTVADPMLRAKYGNDPDRPWTADMVGTGLCYAILTFRFSQSIWTSGEPGWRFELKDTPLYDPRKDSSVGGSGTQRWNNRATWAGSNNPIVQAYNIFRGIELPGLGIWGGEIAASDLPLSAWFAAMNSADQLVSRPGGTTEPRYRAGYEIKVDVEPAAVIEELFKASATRIAEIGGIWKPRTGGPGLPVYFMTDDDIIVTSPQELDPFPGADQRYNGISTNGPNPDAVWEAEPDSELYNATWEAEDGRKRRMASLDLPACPYPLQRQRVGLAYIKDERRFLTHQLTLPPDAAILEPLDTLAWTSQRNGYSTKHFELGDMQDDLPTILQTVSLREVDPTDFNDPPEYGEVVTPIPTTRRPIPAQILAGFTAAPGTTLDAAGLPRRPHIVLIWDGDEQDGVAGIEWEVRLAASGVIVARGSTSNVEAGSLTIFDGILPNTLYQARARQIAVWAVAWSGWLDVTSSDVSLGSEDMSSVFIAEIEKTAELAGVKTVSILPAAGEKLNQVVCLIPPGRLYRWSGTAWTPDLFAAIEAGSLTVAAFAAGIRPVEIVAALPGTGNFAGRVVFLTTDNKLYRYTGSVWTAAIPAADVAGQLTNAQIADLAAAKLTGTITSPQIADGAVTDAKIAGMAASKVTGQLTNAQIADVAAAKLTGSITSTQITDGAVLTAKLAAGAVVADKIAAGAITTSKLAAGAVTATEIAAGAITTAKLAAGAVTATEIAAGAVTAGKIAAGAISATEIAADAVTAAKIAAGAITTSKLAAGAVTANEIAANAIISAKIEAGAITTAKIAAGAVTATEIAVNAVTAAKIAAGAIGAVHLSATDAVITGTAQIANLVVSRAKFAQGALTDMNAIASDPVYTDSGTTNFGSAINISSYDLVLGTTADTCPEKIYLEMWADLASISYTSASGQRFGLIMATEVCKVDKATGAITSLFVTQDQMYDIFFTTTSPYPVAFAFAAKTSARTGTNLSRGISYNVGDDIRVYFYYQKTRALTTGSFTAKLKNTGFHATMFYR